MSTDVKEPHRSRFEELIRRGAGTLDIHDTDDVSSYTKEVPAYAELVEREVGRVDVHRASLVPLLERFVGHAERILDVGCGTGATTVAMALSEKLGAREVIGLDPNGFSLQAATERARGYSLADDRCHFQKIEVGTPLPFPDGSFDLTTCVSVIEYVYKVEHRQELVNQLVRVTRPGGYVLVVTPSPFRLRDYHTHRFFGDVRRAAGYPWASPPWQLEKMLAGCQVQDVQGHQLRHGLQKRGVPAFLVPEWMGFMAWALPWQKVLARKTG